MLSPFFLNSEYTVNDLFIVKQGKMILEKDKLSSEILFDDNDSKSINIKVLTMSSIDFDSKSIDKNNLSDYFYKNNKNQDYLLSANNYIINRVGKNKGMSLIDIDFDFDKTKVIASHHFIVLTPRTIVLENVPFFHMLIDVVLNDLIKNTRTTKGQFITVRVVQDIKISIPFVGFDEFVRNFMEIYEPYKKSLQNFNENKNKMDLFKMKINLGK
jgi:hypothetical protein